MLYALKLNGQAFPSLKHFHEVLSIVTRFMPMLPKDRREMIYRYNTGKFKQGTFCYNGRTLKVEQGE